MCDFKKSDVIELAEAVVAEALYHSDSDYGGWGWNCLFCSAIVERSHERRPDNFPHDIDCTVNVAKAVLTRVGE